MNATPESLIKEYADPIEQQEIDKFICSEMSRQIHRYIKGMSGTKQAMLKFEEKLARPLCYRERKGDCQIHRFESQGFGWTGSEDDSRPFGG